MTIPNIDKISARQSPPPKIEPPAVQSLDTATLRTDILTKLFKWELDFCESPYQESQKYKLKSFRELIQAVKRYYDFDNSGAKLFFVELIDKNKFTVHAIMAAMRITFDDVVEDIKRKHPGLVKPGKEERLGLNQHRLLSQYLQGVKTYKYIPHLE